MNAEDHPDPIRGLDQIVADRIAAELGPGPSDRVFSCLRAAEALLRLASGGSQMPRLSESAVYNLREALDAVVADKPAGEGGLGAAMNAWDLYKTTCALPGADEPAARSELSATLDGLSQQKDRQAFMTRRLLEWFREQTGVDPIPGEGDPTQQYQSLRNRTSRVVHGNCPQAQAEVLFAETVAWFVRFFTPPSDVAHDISRLAGQPYTPACLAEFRSLATNSHHLRLLLERLTDAAWLEPLRSDGLIAPPEPGVLWPVTALVGSSGQLPEASIVELLGRLLTDVKTLPKPERKPSAFEIMRTASWLGTLGHEIVVTVLRQYPSEEWAQMIAMSAAREVASSDPIHYDVADAVIGNEPRHDGGYRTTQTLTHLVAGATPDNVEARFELVAHKTRQLASAAEARYVVLDVSELTIESGDDSEPLVLVARALAGLVATARDMGVSTQTMLDLVEQVPGECGERLACQVLAGAVDIDRQSKLAHLAKRLRSETATGDDEALVKSLVPFADSEIGELQQAFGVPSPPPTETDRSPFGADWPRAWRWAMVLPVDVLSGWKSEIAAVSAKHGEPDPAVLHRPLRSPVAGYGSSPYPTADLAALDPLDAAAKAAAWRPSEHDSWGISARELARSIQSIVQDDPEPWTTFPVEIVRALREPVYVDHYFRGVASAASTVPSDAAPGLIRAVELVRAERWQPTVLGRDDYDYERDWTGVDAAAVELIDALADADADLGADLEHCWSIVDEAANNLPADLGEADRYADQTGHDDPLHGAINSAPGKAVQAQLALGGWGQRNLGTAGPHLEDALDAAISVKGATGLQLRAVIAATRPFVEAIAADWLEHHFDQLFAGDHGRITLDQTLKYSRPTKTFFARSLRLLLDAAHRGVDNAVAWLLIAHLWNEHGYSYDAIIDGLKGAPDALADVAGEIARLGQGLPEDQRELTDMALQFSEKLLTEPAARIPPGALRGLGRWTMAPEVDDTTWLDLTEHAVATTGGHIDYAIEVADRCREAQPSTPALRILTAILGHGDTWEQHHIDGVALEALKAAADGGLDENALEVLRERLIQRGRHDATTAGRLRRGEN